MKNIVQLVGGKDNIVTLSHCMTRLRFVLKDDSLADINEIEKIDYVKGTFTQAGQFQVIVGNNVSTIYKEIIKDSDINTVSANEAKKIASKKQSKFQRATTFLSEIFAPIIPAIIVGGLILGFRNMIELPFSFLGQADIDGQLQTLSLVTKYQFFEGVDSFLWLIGEAIFHFLPVYVTWSAYRKMGGTEVLGLVLGITLVSPQLTNAYAYATSEINFWDFGFFQLDMIGYQGQVIPALMIGLMMGYSEGKINKFVHSSIQMIVTPFVVLVFGALLAHAIVGPIGWFLGDMIAIIFTWLFATFGFFGGMIFGFIYSPLVLTGLHHTTNAIDLQMIAKTGTTPMWPLIALANIAQGASVFAIVFLKKGEKDRELSIPATISAWLGVTEPAMFGVNLKYMYPFVCAMIGSSLASGYSILMGVTSNSIGVGGLPGIMSISQGDYFNFFIAMIIALIVPFILTTIMFKKKGDTSG